jgi:hypothetical protein
VNLANGLQKASWKKRVFLAVFSRTGSLSQAAKAAGVHRRTHYNWLKSDPAYAKAFEQAKLVTGDALEDEAMRRAVKGVKREVLYKGKPVMVNGEPYYETRYSDRLLILLLKAMRPEKYRERSQALVDWDGDPSKLTDAQLAKMHEIGQVQLAEQERAKALQAQMPAPEDVTIDVKPEKSEPDGGTGK